LNEGDIVVQYGTNTKDAIAPLLSKENDLSDDKEPAYDTHKDIM
jgi:hypothetical protein